jgi:hypothetical protein
MTPHDSGIYIYTKDRDGKPKMFVLERTAYQGAKTGGIFTSAMTYGIAKMKVKAVIPGKRATLRIDDTKPVFYFYFDDKAAGLGTNYFGSANVSNPNQFALLRLNVEKTSRTTEISEFSMWGGSSGSNEKSMVAFKSERLRPGLYKISLASDLKAGEFCFMRPRELHQPTVRARRQLTICSISVSTRCSSAQLQSAFKIASPGQAYFSL